MIYKIDFAGARSFGEIKAMKIHSYILQLPKTIIPCNTTLYLIPLMYNVPKCSATL